MAGIALSGFKEKGYFVFLVINGLVLPFNGCNIFDSLFLKRIFVIVVIGDAVTL